jgi:hypothetical protein
VDDDDDDLLPEGPDGNEHVVDRRSVVSESMGKARFGAGGQGKMLAALSIYIS